MEYLWVGLGGFLGANARFVLSGWITDRLGATFPAHTLLINVSGSFGIGLILMILTDRLLLDSAWRLFLVVGFLGGYTTFSSYSFEALSLVQEGRWISALLYGASSNGLGLLATGLGMAVARATIRP